MTLSNQIFIPSSICLIKKCLDFVIPCQNCTTQNLQTSITLENLNYSDISFLNYYSTVEPMYNNHPRGPLCLLLTGSRFSEVANIIKTKSPKFWPL